MHTLQNIFSIFFISLLPVFPRSDYKKNEYFRIIAKMLVRETSMKNGYYVDALKGFYDFNKNKFSAESKDPECSLEFEYPSIGGCVVTTAKMRKNQKLHYVPPGSKTFLLIDFKMFCQYFVEGKHKNNRYGQKWVGYRFLDKDFVPARVQINLTKYYCEHKSIGDIQINYGLNRFVISIKNYPYQFVGSLTSLARALKFYYYRQIASLSSLLMPRTFEMLYTKIKILPRPKDPEYPINFASFFGCFGNNDYYPLVRIIGEYVGNR